MRFPCFDCVDRARPVSGLDGKFSIEYTVAAALLDGEVNIGYFDNERRFRPDMERMLPRASLQFDDTIPRDSDRMHVTVIVTTADGIEHSETVPRLTGWCGIPLPREQRMQKF